MHPFAQDRYFGSDDRAGLKVSFRGAVFVQPHIDCLHSGDTTILDQQLESGHSGVDIDPGGFDLPGQPPGERWQERDRGQEDDGDHKTWDRVKAIYETLA